MATSTRPKQEYLPFTALQPDLDPTTPGIILQADNLHGTHAGYESEAKRLKFFDLPGNVSTVITPYTKKHLVSPAIIQSVEENSERAFIAVDNKIFVKSTSSAAWTDVTGVAWNGAGDDRPCFTQYGKYALLASYNDEILVAPILSATAFARIAGSPKAKYCESIDSPGFAFVANTFEEPTAYPTRVRWSAIGNHTNWTPDIATQAGYFDINATQGPITGLKRLGETIIIYKRRSMTVGRYLGGDKLWGFRELQTAAGTVNHWSIVNTGDAHYFRGPNGFYRFDGSRVLPIDEGVRKYLNSLMATCKLSTISSSHDREKELIRWTAYTGNRMLEFIFHIPTGKWSTANVNGSEVTQCVFFDLVTDYADEVPASAARAFQKECPYLETISTDTLGIFSPNAGISNKSVSIKSGWFGDEFGAQAITRIAPRFTHFDTLASPNCSVTRRKSWNSPVEPEDSTSLSENGSFDFKRAANLAMLTISIGGSNSGTGVAISGINVQYKPAGTR